MASLLSLHGARAPVAPHAQDAALTPGITSPVREEWRVAAARAVRRTRDPLRAPPAGPALLRQHLTQTHGPRRRRRRESQPLVHPRADLVTRPAEARTQT